MILDTKEASCIIQILFLLIKKKSKYSQMFKITKVSHTTLQSALKELINKKFIRKYDIGHMKVDYEITDKGKRLLKTLLDLQEILR